MNTPSETDALLAELADIERQAARVITNIMQYQHAVAGRPSQAATRPPKPGSDPAPLSEMAARMARLAAGSGDAESLREDLAEWLEDRGLDDDEDDDDAEEEAEEDLLLSLPVEDVLRQICRDLALGLAVLPPLASGSPSPPAKRPQRPRRGRT